MREELTINFELNEENRKVIEFLKAETEKIGIRWFKIENMNGETFEVVDKSEYLNLLKINEEHKKINGDLRQELKEVIKENELLRIQVSAREEVCNNLQDNWNKLREWIVYHKHNENTEEHYLVVDYGTLLGKMQELEKSESNENTH